MKKYNVCFGASLRGYAQADFEAENDEAAKAKALEIFKTNNGEDGLDWDDFDYENTVHPSIVHLQRLSDVKFAPESDVMEGHDFAATVEDAQEYAAAEMLSMLSSCRHWINDECERRGKEDAEYHDPAAKMVEQIDALIAKAQKVDA